MTRVVKREDVNSSEELIRFQAVMPRTTMKCLGICVAGFALLFSPASFAVGAGVTTLIRGCFSASAR